MEKNQIIKNKEYLNECLKRQYKQNDIERIYSGYNSNRYVTLRINTIKATTVEIERTLKSEGIEYMGVQWSKEAIIIKNRTEKEIQQLDIYKDGKIYLQSLSSMLPPIVLKPQANEDILDMAAAPGGKTTQIAALTQNKANITACELNTIRMERLKYNVEKQGASSVYIMQKDSRNIDDFFSFDRVLLDAPCSGSGTLDLKDENAFKFFSKKLVEKSVKAQVALLKKALRVLKPGREMVYSTCSILDCENEDVISKTLISENAELVPIEFLGKDSLPLLPVKNKETMCVCPNEFYEGFFIAKIKKIK